MNHIHAFAPHPSLMLLFCSVCGQTVPLEESVAESSRPRRARRPRTQAPSDQAASAAEAELARRIMELPLDEHMDESLRELVREAQERRDEAPVPVHEEERLGADTGL